jgi:GTP cyclohydrolase II
MTEHASHSSSSASPKGARPARRFAVERALGDLRRGVAVVLSDGAEGGWLVLSAELADPDNLGLFNQVADGPLNVVLPARRAQALKLEIGDAEIARLGLGPGANAQTVRGLAELGPDLARPGPLRILENDAAAVALAHQAIDLMKRARLLPAVLAAPLPASARIEPVRWATQHDLSAVSAGELDAYREIESTSLQRVSAARLPLAEVGEAQIVAFRPDTGGDEHLALIVGTPDDSAPLTRLHSQCFTGDVLGSLRCDCGDQLRGAIQAIGSAGGGVLLYLAQEGRGIGLVNKLRAYSLQDQGLDTVDANEQLGFEADERAYAPAAEMLRQLGYSRVRLLTNNPAKVSGLESFGIEIVERVPHAVPAGDHNGKYLATKAERLGHLL